jgi:GrpB-like predicted nucleotidyltransferase (UPF0157 family)
MREPSNIDEPVTVSDYDPRCPTLFESERVAILSALKAVVTRIEHFGGTAVPGMAGKPIVDLLVGVRDLQEASDGIDRLEALGYENFGEIFIPGRLYLRKRGPPHFNAAVTRDGGDFWNTQIIIRNFLRAHPAEAAAYSAFKQSTFSGGARLFSTYSQAKGPFLEALKDRAHQWHDQLGGGRPEA